MTRYPRTFCLTASFLARGSLALGALILGVLIAAMPASACPKINGVPDANCDGNVSVVILGDSIAAGFLDTAPSFKGLKGYASRAQKKLPGTTFRNFADPGTTSLECLRLVRKALSAKGDGSALQDALLTADYVVIDTGRNDRWAFGEPIQTYRNLRRISSVITKEVNKLTGVPPIVITAVMLLPNRGSQGPWMKELNRYILKSHSARHPADLRFDLVSKRLLLPDQLHPTAAGYSALSKVLVTYLTRRLVRIVNVVRPESLRP